MAQEQTVEIPIGYTLVGARLNDEGQLLLVFSPMFLADPIAELCPYCSWRPTLEERDQVIPGDKLYRVRCSNSDCTVRPATRWTAKRERAGELWRILA